MSDIAYVQRMDVITDSAAKELLCLHPVHVIKVFGELCVIGGLRSYQLAISRGDKISKLSIIEHKNLTDEEIVRFARTDILGGVLMHSLGTKSVEQLGVIYENLGKEAAESIAPGVKSIRSRRKFEQYYEI